VDIEKKTKTEKTAREFRNGSLVGIGHQQSVVCGG